MSDYLPEIGPDSFDAEAIEPGVDNLLQEEYPGPAVPVRPVGPVTVHELPTRVSSSRNLQVYDMLQTDPGSAVEQLAPGDLRRKYFLVLATVQPIFVGHEKQAVMDGTAGILPVGIVLSLPTGAAVYARCATPGQAATVSYWSGNWAD